ncbi:MAG: AAA family ATPase [Alphaproteobacteria bacterium]|nr:AAA family ATPase [Alphaproteobacteria bacterium]
MLKSLQLTNFLSFGPDSQRIELRDLNVLIGPNGSGKSNFLLALKLLQSTTFGLGDYLNQNGLYSDWLFARAPDSSAPTITASLDITTFFPLDENAMFVFLISLHNSFFKTGFSEYIYKFSGAENAIKLVAESSFGKDRIFTGDESKEYVLDSSEWNRSILSRYRTNFQNLDIYSVYVFFSKFQFFDEWIFGPRSPIRQPQAIGIQDFSLLADGSNLVAVLNKLSEYPAVQRKIYDYIRELIPEFASLNTRVQPTSLDLFLVEGDHKFFARRLSDGTLRFICLVALLCNPNPPKLLCIEEPELGLHPDMVVVVTKLIKEASTRMQIIVTTHSVQVINLLSEIPESVMVCERDEAGTTIRRLREEEVSPWLENYGLGDYWVRGGIGGNRW